MSTIIVDAGVLTSKITDFKRISSRINHIENKLSTIRSSMDSDVRYRQNIDGRLRQLSSEISDLEQDIYKAGEVVNEAIRAYADVERKLKNSFSELDKDPQQNIIPIIDDVQKYYFGLSEKVMDKLKVIWSIFQEIGSNIVSSIGHLRKFFDNKEREILTNNDTVKMEDDTQLLPVLEGILSYNSNVYYENVKLMQERLNELGYTDAAGNSLEEDGYFGRRTLEAVNKFKEDNELWNYGEYDGKVGETTWEYLFVKAKPVISDSIEKEIPDQAKPLINNDNNTRKIVGTMPSEYEEYIAKLRVAHPNWTFEFIEAPVSWSEFIDAQDRGETNLIHTNYPQSYRESDRNNKDSWSPPVRQVIEHYADPRNFLDNEKNLFQFLDLGYTKENSKETLQGVENILDDTVHVQYAETIMKAAEESGVSAYYLAAKLYAEAGGKGNPLTFGTVGKYNGYYNPYNWNACGKTDKEVLEKGAKYAKDRGWDSMEKGIIEGAKLLGENYINIGQDTIYTQKFDIIGPNFFSHQYMQNIAVAALEGPKLYNVYKDTGASDTNLVFKIPVYKDLPENKISLPQ